MKTFRIYQLALRLMDAKFLQVSCKLRHYYTNLFSFLKLNLNFSIPQCLLQKYSEVTEESSSQVQAFSGLLTCKNQPSDSVDSILNSSSANVTQKCVLFFNPILKDKYWIWLLVNGASLASPWLLKQKFRDLSMSNLLQASIQVLLHRV